MNMTSRMSLLLGATGLAVFAFAGCSSPEDEPTPMNPFQMGGNPLGGAQGGASGAPAAGLGGSAPGVGVGGTGTTEVGQGGAPIGASGASGAPAAGVGGGGGEIPTGTGLALSPVMGWVAGSTNGVGIQGSFYPVSDQVSGGVTMITPADNFMTATGSAICVSGTASLVAPGAAGTPDFDTYWGGGVGFDLADPGNMQPIQPWNRGNVVGFTYTLTGTNIPASLRFQVSFFEGGAQNAGTYCAPAGGTGPAVAGAPVTITLSGPTSQINQSCWDMLSTTKIPDAAPLRSLQWQVATNELTATPFNFCVENLTAVTQ